MRHRDDEFPRCTRMLKSKRRRSKTKSTQTSSMASRARFVFFLFTLFETRLDGVANFSQLVAGITQKETLGRKFPFKLSFAFSSRQFISWSSRDFNVRLILVFGRTIPRDGKVQRYKANLCNRRVLSRRTSPLDNFICSSIMPIVCGISWFLFFPGTVICEI